MTLATPIFEKIRGYVWTVPWNIRFKFEVRIALTVLGVLAFNAQKFRGSRDLMVSPLFEIFKGTVPRNVHVIVEARSFNRCKLV